MAQQVTGQPAAIKTGPVIKPIRKPVRNPPAQQ
jgi:hypothetical protein